MFGSDTWDTRMCGRSLFAVEQGRGRGGREGSHAEEVRRSKKLSCVPTGYPRAGARGVLLAYEAGGDGTRKRESSIYFRLPVPSRSGMIYAERVPRLRAAGEFSLSAPHPAVSSGWRSVPLPSLSHLLRSLSPLQHRREDRDASFSDDVQLPAVVPFSFFLFFFLSFLPGPLPNVSAGGQANHRATTRERAELCALRMNDTRTWGRHLARNLLEASPRNQVTMYGLECHSEKSDTSLLSMRQKRKGSPFPVIFSATGNVGNGLRLSKGIENDKHIIVELLAHFQ